MLHIRQSTLVMTVALASVLALVIQDTQETSFLKSHRPKLFYSVLSRNDQRSSTTTDDPNHSSFNNYKNHNRYNKNVNPPPQKQNHQNKPLDLREKYLMPLISTGSALTQQLRLKAWDSNKLTKILSGNYLQPVLPLKLSDLSNNRPKDSNLIEKIYILGSNLPSIRLFDSVEDASHRNERDTITPKIVVKGNNYNNQNENVASKRDISNDLDGYHDSFIFSNRRSRHKQEDEDEGSDTIDEDKLEKQKFKKSSEKSKKKQLSSIESEGAEKKRKDKIKLKDNEIDKDRGKREEEDKIVNHPIASQRTNRTSRTDLDRNKNVGGMTSNKSTSNNSSYSLTLADGRSLTTTKKNLIKTGRVVAKSAAVLLEPSLESIAMKIVSAAASKTMGRTNPPMGGQKSSSSDTGVGGSFLGLGGGSLSSTNNNHEQPSFLSTLSSTLLTTAISHIMNMTSASSTLLNSPTLGLTSSSSSSTSSSSSSPLPSASSISSLWHNSQSATETSNWPSKIRPLVQSLVQAAGLNMDDAHGLPSPSLSFLSTDLATAASSLSPIFSTSNGTRPHSPKQYSSAMTNFINLARLFLCEYTHKYNLIRSPL